MENSAVPEDEKILYNFNKRSIEFDWRKFASIDVQKLEANGDSAPLRDVTDMIAFCKMNQRDFGDLTEDEAYKLFQVAQMIIEYLLYDISKARTVPKQKTKDREVRNLRQNMEESAIATKLLKKKVKNLQRIMSFYEFLLQSGTHSLGGDYSEFHKCKICLKLFSSSEFLKSHMIRRHVPHEIEEEEIEELIMNSMIFKNTVEKSPDPLLMKQLLESEKASYTKLRTNLVGQMEQEKKLLDEKTEENRQREEELQLRREEFEEEIRRRRNESNDIHKELEDLKRKILEMSNNQKDQTLDVLCTEVEQLKSSFKEGIDNIQTQVKEFATPVTRPRRESKIELLSDSESEMEDQLPTRVGEESKENTINVNYSNKLAEIEKESLEKQLDCYKPKDYSFCLPHMEEVKSIYQHGKDEFSKQRDIVQFNLESSIKVLGIGAKLDETGFHESIQKLVGNRIHDNRVSKEYKEELRNKMNLILEKYRRSAVNLGDSKLQERIVERSWQGVKNSLKELKQHEETPPNTRIWGESTDIEESMRVAPRLDDSETSSNASFTGETEIEQEAEKNVVKWEDILEDPESRERIGNVDIWDRESSDGDDGLEKRVDLGIASPLAPILEEKTTEEPAKLPEKGEPEFKDVISKLLGIESDDDESETGEIKISDDSTYQPSGFAEDVQKVEIMGQLAKEAAEKYSNKQFID